MAWQVWSVVPVWLATLAAAVLVALLAGVEFLEWLPVVLAAALLVGFAVQLAIQRKEGLVVRLIATAAGAFVIVAATTAVLLAIHPALPAFAG